MPIMPVCPSAAVDLGRDYDLTDVTFTRAKDGGTNGDIFEAEVLVSDTADGS